MERLDKFLANNGFGTRKEVKKLIRTGVVFVDGVSVSDGSIHIKPGKETVTVKGQPVLFSLYHYYMLNKPGGVVSATKDDKASTVVELLAPNLRTGVFPVGRLDKDTTGLLLLTDDGDLAHRLLSPGKHVEKQYHAVLDAPATEEMVLLFEKGLTVDADFAAMPAKLEVLPENEVLITIFEGKYHQVKRMFAAVDRKVLRLRRIAMGNLVLDEALAEGEYRKLTEAEIAGLKSLVHLENS